jgi:protein-disulfide isomerase
MRVNMACIAALAAHALLLLCCAGAESGASSSAPPPPASAAAGLAAPSQPAPPEQQAEAAPAAQTKKSAATAKKSDGAPAILPAGFGPTPIEKKSIGSKYAPIHMEVFSDYQCPACRDMYLGTLRPLIENYVNTGKVYLVHRDMPLPTHAHSRLAARYANAAAQVGKFEAVITELYLRQAQWTADGNVDGVVAGVLSAAEIRRVRAMVQSGKLDPGIDADVAQGRKFAVSSTPTTVLTHKGQSNTIRVVMPYDLLRQYLDELLRK